MRLALLSWTFALLAAACVPAAAQCPLTTPVQGAPPPAPLPVFPADNWWNLDISTAPVAANSATYINFIGPTKGMHPDFGGEESPGSEAIYGFPYVIVDGAQGKVAVTFDQWDESDGVNPDTGTGVPFYPVPTQAIAQAHWIEGGPPGTTDIRGDSDRHLLMVDCTNRHLYELYNVWYDGSHWQAYSGAFFDLDTNDRRPDTWTSADASGMAIFPGLVRYDEASNASLSDLGHALRMTVRDTNGYVFPASHDAGNGTNAPPLGARLRLKMLVNGQDPVLRTNDPMARRIFRTMQKYGLIIADNGSDMYISGTFDTRWNNDVLNPAFSLIKASDFEVIELGWNPAPAAAPALTGVSVSPNPVAGGSNTTGTVTLSAVAPAGGITVALADTSSAFTTPASVLVPAGSASANFTITTTPVSGNSAGTLTAYYDGVTRTTLVTVVPATPTLYIANATAFEGNGGTKSMVFTVSLSQEATTAVTYTIATANGAAIAGSDYVASTLTGQTIPAGSQTKTFSVTINGDTTVEPNEAFSVNVSAVTGATVGDGTAVGNIVNDDVRTLSIGDASVTEGNSGTKLLVFTVTLSQASTSAVTYDIATSNGNATGSDYVSSSLTGQSIPAGMLSKTFSVTINGDTTLETNETFFVTLSSVSGATLGDGLATGTILNDDPTLTINDVTLYEGNAGTKSAVFTVSLSKVTPVDVTYTIGTVNGAATAGSDYVASTLTGQTIPAGSLTKTFSVTINGDTAIEANEAFSVVVSSVSGAGVGDGTGVGNIVNDDVRTLSIGDASVTEGNSGTKLLVFTVALSHTSPTPVTYSIATANGSALSGSDYVAANATGESIPAGMLSKTFSVTLNGDTTNEANETFKVNLSAASGATISDAQAVGTILNDDPTLTINNVTIFEGNSGTKTAVFTVLLSQVSPNPVTYTIGTVNGAALAGSDYVASTLVGETIPAGSLSRTFSVTINGDTAVEPNEAFSAVVSAVTGAGVGDGTGVGNIVNDD